MINENIKSITAFAPATCGNAIVGFDIIGLAISGVGDEVTLTRRSDSEIIITQIDGVTDLPFDPEKNIASAVVTKLIKDLDIELGFDIALKKKIPLCSGMGGSAASAVAALTACNHFLKNPLTKEELAYYALQGEAMSSGQAHPDNIVPALYGGITLITETSPKIKVLNLPVPPVMCVLIHPQCQLPTREARQILAPTVPLKTHIAHSAHLAGFISALYQSDLDLLQQSLQDVVIEPQRQKLIPGFIQVKQAALDQGALGVSLSGAGPSMLAFAKNQQQAEKIGQAMQQAFLSFDLVSEIYLSAISTEGAYIK